MEQQKEAENIFLNIVMNYVFLSTEKTMYDILSKEASGNFQDVERAELQKSFLNLDEKQKELFLFAINQTISRTIFNFLVLLDNKLTGYPLGNIPSDFGVYLHGYKNEDDLYKYSPSTSVRINMSYTGSDLHDNFLSLLHSRNNDVR